MKIEIGVLILAVTLTLGGCTTVKGKTDAMSELGKETAQEARTTTSNVVETGAGAAANAKEGAQKAASQAEETLSGEAASVEENVTKAGSSVDAKMKLLAGWREVGAEDGSYRIMMPGEPQKKSQDQNIQGAVIHTDIYQVASSAQQSVYLLQVTAPLKTDPKALFDSTQQSVLASAPGSEVISTKEIAVNDCPGREYMARTADGGELYSRLFLANGNFYQVLVKAPAAGRNTSLAFLDSFRFRQDCAKWKRVASKKLGFSVTLPDTPKASNDPDDPTIVNYLLDTEDFAYLVAYQDISSRLESGTVDDILAQEKEKLLAAYGGKLLEEKTISVNDYIGIEFTIDLPDDEFCAVRMVVGNGKLYRAQIRTSAAHKDAPQIERFLGSFEVFEPETSPASTAETS
ncbi:MAG: hypothetical protein D6795_04490 [Deltaproteobacteria bacterium]|nr:MAG: hypothetical protein D6795_04490 [Deltaproteobacteria bacterium]